MYWKQFALSWVKILKGLKRREDIVSLLYVVICFTIYLNITTEQSSAILAQLLGLIILALFMVFN